MTKLNNILLVDDDEDANFFHSKIIESMDFVDTVHEVPDGRKALDYLKSAVAGELPLPDIIFLDINMPVMDGWTFLTEYEKLATEHQAKIVVVMLTTSLNPDDRQRAESNPFIKGFVSKYLDEDKVKGVFDLLN